MNTVALENAEFKGDVLDHLGLVSATLDKLKLVDKINQRLPIAKEKGAKITMGERVSAMILNGLGFIDDRLYLFPDFLRNKPNDLLFNRSIEPEHFNDDAIGRCLDAIADYGVTKLFTEIALEIGIEQNLLGKTAHFDTSTLSVYGDYEDVDDSSDNSTDFNMAYGYSKAHRPDLKQAVINLATTGKSGFPVWMEAHSGNAADPVILKKATQRMNDFCNSLKSSPHFIYVADSAGYSGFLKQGANMPWLTRVPERIKEAKHLVSLPHDHFAWQTIDANYAVSAIEIHSGGVHQRWVIVESEHAKRRELKTLEKNIQKEESELSKAYRGLARQCFDCAEDAKRAVLSLSKKLKYHQLEWQLEAQAQYAGKGRPRKEQAPEKVVYSLKWSLHQDPEKIKSHQNRKGRFILASNILDKQRLSDQGMLFEYKAQSKTESGFKFIKNDVFQVDSIFLKKESRISALMMVMTLCLMVYGSAQHHLRTALTYQGETLPNQKRVETQKPSMQWIFRLFQGVQRLSVKVGDVVMQRIINLNDVLKRIVCYFGPRAMAIYDVAAVT